MADNLPDRSQIPPEDEVPGLELSYDRVKDVLDGQATLSDHISGKATSIWGIATAIVGIGIPFVATRTGGIAGLDLWLLGISGALWLVATAGFVLASRPQGIELMNEPKIIRTGWWSESPHHFQFYMFHRIEAGYEKNVTRLRWKIRGMVLTFVATIFETIFIVSAGLRIIY